MSFQLGILRAFQVKGTNKALYQEGLIFHPRENVMMSKLRTQMRLEGTSFHASQGRTGMKKRASFQIFVCHIRTTVRKWELCFGIVFIRVTCKLFEFIGFLYSGHMTFQIWS